MINSIISVLVPILDVVIATAAFIIMVIQVKNECKKKRELDSKDVKLRKLVNSISSTTPNHEILALLRQLEQNVKNNPVATSREDAQALRLGSYATAGNNMWFS